MEEGWEEVLSKTGFQSGSPVIISRGRGWGVVAPTGRRRIIAAVSLMGRGIIALWWRWIIPLG